MNPNHAPTAAKAHGIGTVHGARRIRSGIQLQARNTISAAPTMPSPISIVAVSPMPIARSMKSPRARHAGVLLHSSLRLMLLTSSSSGVAPGCCMVARVVVLMVDSG
ncbi:hypothetical protein [Burkholderia anthina]|uniref:hypothetical protein n=1 Tax=Burkholderia anthina TaxID=179879 RepID=UPI00333F4CF8